MRIKTQELCSYTNGVIKRNEQTFQTAVERLSSGLRINSGSDDGAGLQVSTRLKSKTNAMAVAKKNIGQAIDLLKNVDGELNTVTDLIQRIRQLTIKAQSDTYSDEQKTYIQIEVNQLLKEIVSTTNNTQYSNGQVLKQETGISLAPSVNPIDPSAIVFNNASFIPTSGTQPRTYDLLVQVDGVNQTASNKMIRLVDTQTGYLSFNSTTKNLSIRTDTGTLDTGIKMPMGEKVRVSLTYDNGQVSLYLNGEKKATLPSSPITSTSAFKLGDSIYNGFREGVIGTYFKASYYPRALTDQEVLSNYKGITVSGAEGSWDFEEDSGTIVKDISGNENNGSLVGNATRVIYGKFRVNTGENAADSREIIVSPYDLKIGDLDVTDPISLKMLDNTLGKLLNARTSIGSEINRLNFNQENSNLSLITHTASYEKITNVDIAAASTNILKTQIIQQSSLQILLKEKEYYQNSLQLLNN